VFPDIVVCKLCSLNQIESKYHFPLCCSIYRCLKTKYFANLHWPSLQKCVRIMSCRTKRHMLKLYMCIRDALEVRLEEVNSYILKMSSPLQQCTYCFVFTPLRMFRHILLIVYMFILGKRICMLNCPINKSINK